MRHVIFVAGVAALLAFCGAAQAVTINYGGGDGSTVYTTYNGPYVRIFTPWDTFGDGQYSCTTQNDQQSSALTKLNTIVSAGKTPVIAFEPSQIGQANPGTGNLTEYNYYCGVTEMLSALRNSSYGNLQRDGLVLEPWNEPESCPAWAPNNGVTPALFASYWNSASGLGITDLAGAFLNAPSTPWGVCSSDGVPDETTFWNDFYSDVKSDHGSAPAQWSFHDYQDADYAAQNDYYGSQGLTNVRNWYDGKFGSYPSPSNVWITEYGPEIGPPYWVGGEDESTEQPRRNDSGNQTKAENGDYWAGVNFAWLDNSSWGSTQMFWYEFVWGPDYSGGTCTNGNDGPCSGDGDDWDSALTYQPPSGSAEWRPSYCGLLGYAETSCIGAAWAP